MIYFPTNWGAKEPQNLPNHRVEKHIGLTPFPFLCFSEALLNAVVFGVQGTAERALKGLWSDDRPQLTGLDGGSFFLGRENVGDEV